MPAKRILITGFPYADRPGYDPAQPWTALDQWPSAWICAAGLLDPPCAVAYRRVFTLDVPAVIRCHVSADERYELFLDGERIGDGSERGDRAHWYYETYELDLAPGRHALVARVWSLGKFAPWAQISVGHGFICAPGQASQVTLLGTGVAPWEAKRLPGIGFRRSGDELDTAMGAGAAFDIDAATYAWDHEAGSGTGWMPVERREAGTNGFHLYSMSAVRLMLPATLPEMVSSDALGAVVRHVSTAPADDAIAAAADIADEHAPWQSLLDGHGDARVPAGARRRVVIDLGDYVCAYPYLRVSGGAGGEIRVRWAEALFEEGPGGLRKGDRDTVEGRRFAAFGDRFRPDGPPRSFSPPWWRAGRYVQVEVTTGTSELVIEALSFRETRYPLDAGIPATGEAALDRVLAISLRTLQMCAHETYMDCPYYEQLMYVGDTRIQALAGYALTRDDRLARKALVLFDSSRANPTGLVTASHPGSAGQIIPPFALWHVCMVHDFARWRGDRGFIASLMPGVRAVLDRFLAARGDDALSRSLLGWNYVDGAFPGGVPPGGEPGGVSGVLNWQLVIALGDAAELERWIDEPELAARCERARTAIVAALIDRFWDERRGLFADVAGRTSFSEHSQCLAIISGAVPPALIARASAGLFADPDLARSGAYFSHYLFETCRLAGRGDALFACLAPWREAVAIGMRTFPEHFGATRSDCHAWSAHPLFHWQATVLGVRPAAFGFERVEIRPQPGPLARLAGSVAHPLGSIDVDLDRQGQSMRGTIRLPGSLRGRLLLPTATHELEPGLNHV